LSELSPGAMADWVGRSEAVEDMITSSTVGRLAALLDHERTPWHAGEVPPLGHWLGFLPAAAQSHIDVDGHPKRGGFLPPIALPRRMWAGSSIDFRAPLPVDAPLRRRATIVDIQPKTGASGTMVFVTVRYEIAVGGETAIDETQTIVYREAAASARSSSTSESAAFTPSRSRAMCIDSVQLFRFSALTFNAHRIHYDRDYARGIEGYPGLVVHGPFAAMLLMDDLLRHRPQVRPSRFIVRATRPLFEGENFHLQSSASAHGEAFRVVNASGHVTMTAQVVI
jgi:3-methylfumaryl-CoA hydratase